MKLTSWKTKNRGKVNYVVFRILGIDNEQVTIHPEDEYIFNNC